MKVTPRDRRCIILDRKNIHQNRGNCAALTLSHAKSFRTFSRIEATSGSSTALGFAKRNKTRRIGESCYRTEISLRSVCRVINAAPRRTNGACVRYIRGASVRSSAARGRARSRARTHGNAAFTLALALALARAGCCVTLRSHAIGIDRRCARRGATRHEGAARRGYARKIDEDEVDAGRAETKERGLGGEGRKDGSALKRLVTSAMHERWTCRG